jgi:hypothetical protein
MTTITLSKTLLDTDLSSISSTSTAFNYFNESDSLTAAFRIENVALENPIVSGKTTSYINPSISSTFGKVTLTGKISRVDDSKGNFVSGSIDIKGMTIDSPDGKLNYKSTISGSVSTKKISLKVNATEINFTGNDGSGWSMKCDLSAAFSVNLQTENIEQAKITGV